MKIKYLLCLSIGIGFTSFAYAEVCWKHSYGRGIGKIPKECPEDTVRSGLLCYPKCESRHDSTYTGVASVCWQDCPENLHDDGAFCRKGEPKGRGVGRVKEPCSDKGFGTECEKCGALYYQKCPKDYHAFGCNICTPTCPAGMTDIGVSCAKDTYIRQTFTPSCGEQKQYDAGLCYDQCAPEYNGVGPACWLPCPAGMVDCGAICGSSLSECTEAISSMVFSTLDALANLADTITELKTANITGILTEAQQAIKIAAQQTLQRTAMELSKTLLKDVEKKILLETFYDEDVKIDPMQRLRETLKEDPYIQKLSEKNQDLLIDMMLNPEKFDYKAALEELDFLGIAKVVRAFNKPFCTSDMGQSTLIE
jgi:hypothetical protein